jgi:hypothetical protein
MDLIYTNAAKEDLGILLDYELDLAFGADENNFECSIASSSHCCEAGSLLYIEGTEYGGIVDSIESKTDSKEVVYSGRTWHGILNSKVLEPDSGEDYLVLTGEANYVLGALIERMALSDMFKASSADSGLNISGYKMNRYISGYDGIRKMLKTVDARLAFTVKNGEIILSAVLKHDYSQDDEFDSDLVDFNIRKKFKAVNHLVCLGSGELADRMVVHLFADSEGNISRTQTQFGLDEFAEVYDYSNTESEEELVKGGEDKLKELWEPAKVSVDFDADTDNYGVGDVVGAFDNITGISVSAEITKKIVTIENGQITISYKVGE